MALTVIDAASIGKPCPPAKPRKAVPTPKTKKVKSK